MAHKLAELQALSDEELIRLYDEAAPQSQVGVQLYGYEVNRRAQEHNAAAMRRLTLWTVRLAVVSIGVAILALVVAVTSLWR